MEETIPVFKQCNKAPDSMDIVNMKSYDFSVILCKYLLTSLVPTARINYIFII